ncbi:MAG: hypothetical protein RLZ55_1145 [Actinomycetota bacterium]|jgi:uncharacterized membrane protein
MKVTGIILAVLGVLLGILGFVAPVIGASVAVGKVNSTDSTTNSTADVKYLNQEKLVAAVAANNPEAAYDTVQLESTRVTQAQTGNADAEKAGASLFNTVSVNKLAGTDTVFTASPGGEALFAFNPADSQLINCCAAGTRAVDPATGQPTGEWNTSIDFQGVMPLKFPFASPQDTLQVYNGDTQTAVETKYAGEVEQYGMTLYKYTQSVPATQLPGKPLLEVPMSLAKVAVGVFAPAQASLLDALPQDQPVALYRFTTQENEFLVEPLTGQIVDGHLVSKDTARLNNGDVDILNVATLDGKSANVEEGAAEIKSSADLLKMVGLATPILLVLGLILLIVGIVLIVLASKKKKAAAAPAASS